jgi:predicted lipoprotein with Yx(FWY)xxD motif
MLMKRNPLLSTGLILVVGLVVLIVAMSGGSAKNRRSPIAAGSALNVGSTSLGKTLVDANGRTLYLFQADKPNVSTLSNAGLAVWPPFTSTGTPQAEGGAKAAEIGTITGPSGSKQVTYNGHPLYYYVGDHQPGSARGQRLNQFGALWYVLTPSGNAVTTAPSNPPPASPAPTGSYGY